MTPLATSWDADVKLSVWSVLLERDPGCFSPSPWGINMRNKWILVIFYGGVWCYRKLSTAHCERSNLRRKYRNNWSSTKASFIIGRKPTLHLCCMLAPSTAVFHTELQVQIANIYRLAIKEKKIMVSALPVQQQTAVHLPVWVWGNCHCFNLPFFSWWFDWEALFLYICTAHVCNQNGSTRK